MSRWFRHYAGMMRDDKLVRVAIRSKQPIERVVWVYGAILESAAEVNTDGTFDVDAAEIAYFLRADEADIEAIFAGLGSAGHIAAGAVVKWGDRQFKSDTSKDRQAAYRERKKAESGDTDVRVTSPNRHRDAPETELDTECSGAKAPSPQRARKSDYPMPEGTDPKVWADFLTNRRRKNKPNTASAHKRLMSDLRRLSDDEWPPGRLLEHAAAEGWAGIYDPRTPRNGQSNVGNLQRPRASNPTLDILRAANAELAQCEGREDHLGTGLALPAPRHG